MTTTTKTKTKTAPLNVKTVKSIKEQTHAIDLADALDTILDYLDVKDTEKIINNPKRAWIFGVIVGWGPDIKSVALLHRWTPRQVSDMNRYLAAIKRVYVMADREKGLRRGLRRVK